MLYIQKHVVHNRQGIPALVCYYGSFNRITLPSKAANE